MRDAFLPAHNLDAEEYVLGALLLGPAEIDRASSRLDYGDFYRHSHGLIFRAVVAMREAGRPVDVVTLPDELERRGELAEVGGKQRIAELHALVPAANVVHWADIVARMAYSRRLFDACTEGRDASGNGGDTQQAEERILEVIQTAPSARADISVVPLDDFADRDEPSMEPLLGDHQNVLIGADTSTLFYGNGGAGKTTLAIDLVAHLAAGIPWLGIAVPRPVRVLMIENEGSRGLYRLKLRRKRDGWRGPPFRANVFVVEEPWGRATLSDARFRRALADKINGLDIDLLVAGPLKRLGMEGGGTPDEVSRFSDLLGDLRARVLRPLADLLIHHENKLGGVSGAWSGEPTSLVRIRADRRERTLVHFEKARGASDIHDTSVVLGWAENEGFEVLSEEGSPAKKQAAKDAAKAEEEKDCFDWICEYVEGHPGLARGRVEDAYAEAHGGKGRSLARRILDREIEAFEASQGLAGTAPDGEPSREPCDRLAVCTRERSTGKYLYPASYAGSRLADSQHGEPREQSSAPPQGATVRGLAAALGEGGEPRAASGEGQEEAA